MSESSKKFPGSERIESLSDKGYFSMKNIKSLADNCIDAYIPEAKHGMPDRKTGIPKPEFHEPRFIYDEKKDIHSWQKEMSSPHREPENNERHKVQDICHHCM